MGKSISRPIRRFIGARSIRVPPPPSTTSDAVDEAIVRVDPTFVLAVSHTPWVPARVESLARMRETLRPANNTLRYHEVTDRLPNWQWSQRMWTWAHAETRATGATHAVLLQDDLDLHPLFWPVLRAAVGAAHNRVISLIANHPYSRRAVDRGDHWFLTSECLGSGYVLPAPLLHAFLEWRSRLPTGRLRSTNEDFLITCWVNATRRRTWHPVPSLIDHRCDIASTNPRDKYPFRRSYVRWDAAAVAHQDVRLVDTWRPEREPLDFGFDATSGDIPLGVDPGWPPSRQDPAILAEHARIVRDESSGIRY